MCWVLVLGFGVGGLHGFCGFCSLWRLAFVVGCWLVLVIRGLYLWVLELQILRLVFVVRDCSD